MLSRITGFARDIVLAATLGAGLMNDAFVVAFRLPNHFRAIFGEGAFNAAFVPSYARVLETKGAGEAKTFSSRIFTLLLASQVLLLVLALVFTPFLVDLLAPGFRGDPQKFNLAVALTRVTFPYLLFVTLVTLHAGVLNASVWDKLVAAGKVDTKKVHVFATTPTYYDYNWTVRGSLDPELAGKIKAAFLALDPAKPEHKAILDLQAASRFIETKPENYKGIEEAARAAGLLK